MPLFAAAGMKSRVAGAAQFHLVMLRFSDCRPCHLDSRLACHPSPLAVSRRLSTSRPRLLPQCIMSSKRRTTRTAPGASSHSLSSSSTASAPSNATPSSSSSSSSPPLSSSSSSSTHGKFFPHSLRDLRTDSTSNFGFLLSQKPTAIEEQRIQRLIEDKLLQSTADDEPEDDSAAADEQLSASQHQQSEAGAEQSEQSAAAASGQVTDATTAAGGGDRDGDREGAEAAAAGGQKAAKAHPPTTLPASLPSVLPSSITSSSTSVFALRDLLPFVSHGISNIIQTTSAAASSPLTPLPGTGTATCIRCGCWA